MNPNNNNEEEDHHQQEENVMEDMPQPSSPSEQQQQTSNQSTIATPSPQSPERRPHERIHTTSPPPVQFNTKRGHAEPNPIPELILLHIKNPVNRDDATPFLHSFPPTATIQDLKHHLCETYPGNPSPEKQRLIYGGRVLHDQVTVGELIPLETRRMFQQHTMHLVVRTDEPPNGARRVTPPPPPPPPRREVEQHGRMPPTGEEMNASLSYVQRLELMHGLIARLMQMDAEEGRDAEVVRECEQLLRDVERNAQTLRLLLYIPDFYSGMNGMNEGLEQMIMRQQQQQQQQQGDGMRQQINANDMRRLMMNNIAAMMQQARGNGNGNVNAERERNGNEPVVRQFVFQFEIDWSLILKIILLIGLFAQGGSRRRVYSLAFVGVMVYLWHAGYLAFAGRFVRNALPNPRRVADILFPVRREQVQGELIREDGRWGRVSMLVVCVYAFVYGFCCSLLPSWIPEPLPDVNEVVQDAQVPQVDHDVHAHAHAD